MIVGGGVTGLVTVWTLVDKGCHITILAKGWASYGSPQRLTSQIAGALWEFPPASAGSTQTPSRCVTPGAGFVLYLGRHRLRLPRKDDPSSTERAGVRMKHVSFFFPEPVEGNTIKTTKMLEIMARGVRGLRHSASIIEEQRVSSSYGAVDAYEHLAPGQGRPASHADAIVNATGLAGTELAGDNSCYQIWGGLIRVINDGCDFPMIDAALTISANAAHSANEIAFLMPRNGDVLLSGGITKSHEPYLDLTLDSPIVRRMRARCEAFFPELKKDRLDADYPLAQRLRPFGQRNIRVERELRIQGGGADDDVDTDPSAFTKAGRIVHNYGHSAAGWSVSFRCAGDVAVLVEEALLDLPLRPMMLETEFLESLPKTPEAIKVGLGDRARL
ncbi:nucleotide-binding domain-containing protein [Apiospora hydei]|uniref:Nucleotide-binding domain-containing protein n=1 Tax=Apiospora hydei TaxID=1337664 RepID=A0ABR1WNM2_9PEZI